MLSIVGSGLIRDELTRRVYLTWLARDIQHALAALCLVYKGAGRTPPPPETYLALDAFLTSTAKVSKMLKPVLGNRPKKDLGQQEAFDRRQQRGEYLCQLLEVGDDSAVLDRGVRNVSDHFDERLDDWLARCPRPTAEQVEMAGMPPWPPAPMPGIDPERWIVTLAGRTLKLKAVQAELERILAQARQLEPLARWQNPAAATLFSTIPRMPPQLRLDAPTRRPDEHMLTGIDRDAVAALDQQWNETISRIADTSGPLSE